MSLLDVHSNIINYIMTCSRVTAGMALSSIFFEKFNYTIIMPGVIQNLNGISNTTCAGYVIAGNRI